MSPLRTLGLWLRLIRPHVLLGGALLYGLGAAIAHYLLRPFDPAPYWLGQALVTSIQLAALLLHEHHEAEADSADRTQAPFDGDRRDLRPDGLPRRAAFYGSIVCLALATSLATAGLVQQVIPPAGWALLVLSLMAGVFYSQPPLRLVDSGYGELVASIVVAGLVPSFAFSLQTGELHGLLFTVSLPLVSLHFAMLLVFTLAAYPTDRAGGRQTLMVRLGWPAGVRLHDAAVGFAVLALAVGAASGLPWRVALGAMIALPLAAAQVVQMRRIRAGRPPHWGSLTAGAMGLFALSAYLLLAGFLLFG